MYIWPPGVTVEAFVLAPENVWYCRVRLLFDMSVKVDTSEDTSEIKCAFVSVCKEIVLDDSGEMPEVCHIKQYLYVFDHIERHVTILYHIM